MADTSLNIWSSEPDLVAATSTPLSPILPPQSPKVQKALRLRAQDNSLAQARVLAIFRSGKFPNKVSTPSVVLEDLEQDSALEFLYSCDVIDESGDMPSIRPDFEEDLFDAEETSFSSDSSSSTSSTPVEDFIPHWHSRLQAVLHSRSKEECASACRVLVLSNEWDLTDIYELAYQFVASGLAGMPPVTVSTCALNIKRMLLEASKHEEATYFASCISESALTAWHYYWNPGTTYSIYPGRSFIVNRQYLEAAYTSCQLLGRLFQAKMVARVRVKEVIDLTLQNALLLEHIDAIGHLLSYASTEFWAEASANEKDVFMQELYDVLEKLCDFHQLRPELVDEYEVKLEEICGNLEDNAS